MCGARRFKHSGEWMNDVAHENSTPYHRQKAKIMYTIDRPTLDVDPYLLTSELLTPLKLPHLMRARGDFFWC